MSDVLRPLIGLAAERPLTRAEAERAFEALFNGEGTPAQKKDRITGKARATP